MFAFTILIVCMYFANACLKTNIYIVSVLVCVYCMSTILKHYFYFQSEIMSEEAKNAKSIYDFTVKDTHGEDVSLEKYQGNVVLIVNIASQCGLTKNNYKKLTELREKYGDKGLKILNFPCNQFGSQMPETDGEPMVCHLRDAKADIGDVFKKVG